MSKCVDCAYFLNCDKANSKNTCEKYLRIRKEIVHEKPYEEKSIKNKIKNFLGGKL